MSDHFPTIKPGDRIFHVQYGYGIVTNTNYYKDPGSIRTFIIYFDNDLKALNGKPKKTEMRIYILDTDLFKVN